ncbi:MAG: PAS domain S-box protein [Candidatus Eisenbacteria bacterium]
MRFSPPAILVNAELEILEVRGVMGPYLLPGKGEPGVSLLEAARQDLVGPLKTLAQQAKVSNAPARKEQVRFESGAEVRMLNLEIVPVGGTATSDAALLVLFEEAATTRDHASDTAEAVRVPLVVLDRELRVEHANRAFYRTFASEPAATIGASIFALGNREWDLPEFRELLEALPLGETSVEDLRIEHDLGESSRRIMLLTARRFADPIRRTDRILLSFEDITQREQHQQELQRAREYAEAIARNAHDPILILDSEFRVHITNQAFYNTFKVTPEETQGRSVFDLGNRQWNLPRLRRLLEAIKRRRSFFDSFEVTHDFETIGRRTVRLNGRALNDGCGEPASILLNIVDITDQLHFQSRLRRSELRHRRLFEATNVGVLIIDPSTQKIVDANPFMTELLGCSHGELLGKQLFQIGLLKDEDTSRAAFRELQEKGFIRHDELSIETSAGERRQVEMISNLYLESDDNVVQCNIHDVTERDQDREALRASESKFRALADNIPQLAWMAHSEAQLVWFNQVWLEYTGTTLEENLGQGWFAVLHPDHVDAVAEKFMSHLRDGLDWEDTFPLRGKDGRYRWFLSRMKAIRDETGKLERFFGTNTDVTERRELDREREAFAERYRVLFDLGPVAVFSCNRDGVLQNFNRRAAELWGREPDCGNPNERFCGSLRLHRPDGRLLPHAESPIVKVLESGVIAKDVDVVIERPDGSRISAMVTFAPLKNEAGEVTGAITAFYDVTERKRLEHDLARRVEELAALDSAKGRFLAVLAHELRSPLNAIRGWLQVLQRPDAGPDDLKKGLDVIDRNSRIQIQLIGDLLDAHRIGAGKASLDLQPVDLGESIVAAVEAAWPAAEEKGIRIKREIEATAMVSADTGRLMQVFGNLLANALKFTPPGGEIMITLRRAGSRAEVTISDTGEGIDPEALPRIFDLFRQGNPTASRDHAGLGLGLSIAKQLVELHAGTIEAKSPGKGKGATFTITLPLRALDTPSEHPVLGHEAAVRSLGGIMVLVVDDEPDAREAMRRVLQEAGAEVVAVGSVGEALDAIRQQRPDVLISDIGIPGRDGYELIQAVRAMPAGRGGHIPAIALTACGTPEDRTRALDAGFKTHLVKPVELVTLIAAVTAVCPDRGPNG